MSNKKSVGLQKVSRKNVEQNNWDFQAEIDLK